MTRPKFKALKGEELTVIMASEGTGKCRWALEQSQYIVEGIILRRLHEKRIEGYTIETAKEIVEALGLTTEGK